MSKTFFKPIGLLWEKQDSGEGHLLGEMMIENQILNIQVHPNLDKTNEDDPDFKIVMDTNRKPMTAQEIKEMTQLLAEIEEAFKE